MVEESKVSLSSHINEQYLLEKSVYLSDYFDLFLEKQDVKPWYRLW